VLVQPLLLVSSADVDSHERTVAVFHVLRVVVVCRLATEQLSAMIEHWNHGHSLLLIHSAIAGDILNVATGTRCKLLQGALKTW
jgi:hypothetical protein